jgi:hypothetical protein
VKEVRTRIRVSLVIKSFQYMLVTTNLHAFVRYYERNTSTNSLSRYINFATSLNFIKTRLLYNLASQYIIPLRVPPNVSVSTVFYVEVVIRSNIYVIYIFLLMQNLVRASSYYTFRTRSYTV